MSYLVDTNVFSEGTKPVPDTRIQAWLAAHENELFVSALTIGEMRYGIDRLARRKRREALEAWLKATTDLLAGRVLSVTPSVAQVWGQLRAGWSRKGLTVPSIDGLLAATASRHGLTVVTRNRRDFAGTGVKTLDPLA